MAATVAAAVAAAATVAVAVAVAFAACAAASLSAEKSFAPSPITDGVGAAADGAKDGEAPPDSGAMTVRDPSRSG